MTDHERTQAAIDWDDVERWGQLGHNVHEAAWAPDPLHADETGDQ